MARTYDIAVIGGGINGCGIARDAAGRGLSVLLVEKADLASGTSSTSTKLIHGGLRYLEHYEFLLVRAALIEREVLLRMAPHVVWPMRFVLPHHKELRPRWLIRLGLFLYDHLGGRKLLPASRPLDLRQDPAGAVLKAQFSHGFEYSDCWVDDARLVVLNARDAAARGADIRVRTELTSAERHDGAWRLDLEDRRTGESSHAAANVLINAAGPWVASVIANRLRLNTRSSVRLVKGSHIVVKRLFDHDRAYMFQNADGRVIFAIPYEHDFTLIGTTDVDVPGEPDDPHISQAEIDYLCAAVSGYFRQPVAPGDVVWTYAGVRPLFDDGEHSAQETTRDYVLELDGDAGEAPLLSVFGGKITTFRHLGEEALQKLAPWLPGAGDAWTAQSRLPGGDFGVGGTDGIAARIAEACPALAPATAERYARTYGTEALGFLADMGEAAPGRDFGAGLHECELRHLMQEEWALSVDDVIWRRTKLGLRLSEAQVRAVADWMAAAENADTGSARSA